MKKLLVVNGPNLNMLGNRDAGKYGKTTLSEINGRLKSLARTRGAALVFFQSNHEGKIIDFLQEKSSRKATGILINPGALTHYGYSLRDALSDTRLPVVEVHLSDINSREKFRKTDVLDGIAVKRFMGKKENSYSEGLLFLLEFLSKK